MAVKKTFIDMMPSYLVWIFSRPYIAGDSMEKALKRVDELWHNHKKMSTVDLLGEAVSTREEAEYMVQIYLDLVEKLKDKATYATVSLKPSSMGISISKDYCIENISKIVKKANSYGLGITLDMEGHDLTDVTLDMYRTLKPQYSNFGTVLQSRLFRTGDDIKKMPNNAHILLCIGIYLEPSDIALTKKSDMKKKLVEYAGQLVNQNAFVGVATHDETAIREALTVLEQKGITPKQAEFQFLLGVPREKIQNELLQKGWNVRLYVPFATKRKYATAYCKRRFYENPNMAVYVTRNLLANRIIQVLILLGIIAVAVLAFYFRLI